MASRTAIKDRTSALARPTLRTVIAGCVLVLLTSCSTPSDSGSSRRPSSPLLDTDSKDVAVDSHAPRVLFPVPEFQLTEQNGAPFGTQDLAGNIWIANFIFTNCTATCPKQTSRFEALQQHAQHWPDYDRVRLISITVDPERDTVAELRSYADLHQADHQHWKFLTGNRAEITRISKDGFKLPVSDESDDPSIPITHSSQFVLVDSRGNIRGFYDGLSDEDFR